MHHKAAISYKTVVHTHL